jgi:hypothetical protein
MTKAKTVCDALESFFEDAIRPVLFAGAGVSMKAGLPNWYDFVSGLAEQLRARDALTRHLMMECLGNRQYTRAAEYFFLSEGFTDGQKLQAISEPLRTYDASQVAPLAALPFASYVTTNYDRVLLDAYAKYSEKAAFEVNLGDPTLTSAPYHDSFYVARIHGRMEVPATMVLSRTHYERLYETIPYIDFLRHLFCSRSLLFVGFSFLDPAIQLVLRAVRDQVGAVHAGRHVALVDTRADAEFLTELNRHNIQCVRYAPDDAHLALWDGIERYRKLRHAVDISMATPQTDAFAYARQYFAAALTRRHMGAHMRPLKQAVAEGMVLEMIRNAGDAGLLRAELAQTLSEQLHIQISASSHLVDSSLQGLATDGLYVSDADGRICAVARSREGSGLAGAISTLVDGAIQRYVVRESGKDNAKTRDVLARYFEYLVLRRGWDMGAAYAARRPPQAILVEELLTRLLKEQGSTERPPRALIRAVEGVLLSPSDEEATVLAELGRLAFALELVRQSPQDTLFSSNVLPTRIYLDANVLLPAIVEGHPFNKLYSAAMDKLLVASAASSSGLEVCVYVGFLNEVVSHRGLAQADMKKYGARAAEFIARDVRLYGAAHMNVFVAGFARTLIAGATISFDQYLAKFAPYRTERELEAWLRSRGMRVIDQRQMLVAAKEYPAILHHFETMFSKEIASRTRAAILVAHDALQVAVLLGDMHRGDRAVLVTADKQMRDAVAYSDFQNIGTAMLSGVGLVQMIELLVGAIGDDRSMAQLLWSTTASNPAEKIRRYLVDIALSQYDAALAMNMESIVRELTEDISFAIEKDTDQFSDGDSDGERLSLGKYLEAFEPKFYELMRAQQERLKEKDPGGGD